MGEEKLEAGAAGAAEAKAGDPAGLPDWIRFPLVLTIVGVASAAALSALYSLTKEKIEESKSAKVLDAFRSILDEATFEKTTDASGREHYVLTRADGTKAYAAQVKCPGSYNTGEPIELVVVLSADLSRVLGARVVKSAETPGLGQRVKEPPAARSIVGAVTGRPAKERVVLREGGALVGIVERKDNGSIVFIDDKGDRRSFMKDEYVRVEAATAERPFPPAYLDQLTGVALDKAKLRADGGVVDAITGATISSTAVMNGVAEATKLLREALGKSE